MLNILVDYILYSNILYICTSYICSMKIILYRTAVTHEV